MIARRIPGNEMAEANWPQASAPAQPKHRRVDVLQMVWRQRWIVLLTTVVCLAAGFSYLVRAVPIFGSSSRVYVQQSGPRIINENQGVMTESHNYLYTQCELIKATPVLSSVADLPETRAMKTFAHMDNIVPYLRSKLTAEVDNKNDIITVSFECPYPAEAAQIVNSVVDGYVTSQSAQKRSTAAEVLKILEKEKAKRDAELAERLKKMMEFKQSHPNLSFAAGEGAGNVITQALARLSEALTTARLAAIEAKTTYDLTAGANRKDNLFVTPEITTLRSEIRQGSARLEDMARDLGPSNKQVQSLVLQINRARAELTKQQQEANDAGLAALQRQGDIAVQKEKEIQRQVDEQEKLAIGLNSTSAEYGLLEAELQRVQKISDIVDSRIKELNVTEDVGALNISILDAARPAGAPIKPERGRVMGMALLLGLMLGVGFGLLRESMDQRLQSSAEEVGLALGMPVLGVVPHMSGAMGIVERGQSVHLEPMSEIAEAFRTIRTAVFFGSASEAKTILVTSPCPGDGKTTSASNIAVAMAQAGYRTLLLDADCRRPTQHKVFAISDKVGLSSVISGQAALADAIQSTAVEGLSILPCGPVPANPAEMLNGKVFAKLVEELGGQFDRIIFDSAPIIPVADGRILAAFCDITLLVLRAERSTLKLSEQARDALESVGANIMGIVLNDMPRRRQRYGYGYGYGYGYTYGYRSRRKLEKEASAVVMNGAALPDVTQITGTQTAASSDASTMAGRVN